MLLSEIIRVYAWGRVLRSWSVSMPIDLGKGASCPFSGFSYWTLAKMESLSRG